MPSFKSIKFSLILLFSISLAACGGGGSSGGSDPTKPTVENFTKSISKSATTIGTLTANNGGKAITAFALSGADAASFDVSTAGVISVKATVTLDPVTKDSYAFKATATNEIGTSAPANVAITITTSKPTIQAFTTSIPENSTAVGAIDVDNGGKAITAYTLSGTDSADFEISTTGVISVKSTSTLDSTVKSAYAFTVTAENALGTSDPANVSITLTLVEQNFAGKTPKLMQIGDSITAGKLAAPADLATIIDDDAKAAGVALAKITTVKARLAEATPDVTLAGEEAAYAKDRLTVGNLHFYDQHAKATEAIDKAIASIGLAKAADDAVKIIAVAVKANTDAITAGATQAQIDAAVADNAPQADIDAAITAGATQAQLDAIILNTAANVTLAGTFTAKLATALTDAGDAIAPTKSVQEEAQLAKTLKVALPSYRKNLNALAAADTTVNYDAIGIAATGGYIGFGDDEHEGYSGWLAEQLTNKNAVSASAEGVIFSGGAVEMVDGKVVYTSEVTATDICTSAKVTSGEAGCTNETVGQVITDVFKDKFSVMDYSLSANLGNNNPEIALIHIGTNDMAFKRISTEFATNNAIAGVKELIATLRAKNDRVVILLAQIIPIADTSQFYTVDVIEGYNARIATLAGEEQSAKSPIVLVDQFTPFKNGDLNALLIDGVHPTAAGDELMAQTWMAALKKFFKP